MSNATSITGFSQSGTLRNQFPTQSVATATETQLAITTDSGTASYFIFCPYGSLAIGDSVPRDVNSNPAIMRRSGRESGLPSGEPNGPFSTSSWDGHHAKN